MSKFSSVCHFLSHIISCHHLLTLTHPRIITPPRSILRGLLFLLQALLSVLRLLLPSSAPFTTLYAAARLLAALPPLNLALWLLALLLRLAMASAWTGCLSVGAWLLLARLGRARVLRQVEDVRKSQLVAADEEYVTRHLTM